MHLFWMLTRSHDIFLNNCSPLPPVLSLDHIVPRLLYHYSCPGRKLSDSSAFLSPCLSVSQCKIFPSIQTAHCCRGLAWQTKECTCTVKFIMVVIHYCQFQINSEESISVKNWKKHPSQIFKTRSFLRVMNFICSWIDTKWWIHKVFELHVLWNFQI